MKSNKKKEKEKQENLQKMDEVVKNKNIISEEYSKKIKGKIFENIIINIVFVVYLFLINLGSQNIESEIYLTDLKVFSVGLLITAIIIFERSYNKDNGSLCIHGIEVLVLALITLISIYLYSLYVYRTFSFIMVSIIIITVMYFTIKSLITYFKMQNQYFKSKDDISEIVKK